MKRLPLKKQMLLTVSAVVLLLFLVTLLVALPRAKSILQIRETIIDRQTEVEKQHSQSRKLRLTLLELDRSLDVAREISQATVSTGQELDIIEQLESLSDSYGIDQNLSVAVQDVPKDSPYLKKGIKKYYELSFLNHGRYDQHIAYLSALEHLPYYMIIDQLAWEINAAKKEQQVVTLKFTGKVYIYSQ